ncbi:hypothetical protein NECAME_01464 [Necator americanus]|uniref:Uncharacterized protein n=1 Tax=Necator americanus TaxID=51031 RepID=W2TX23_NECAM|nr:hypothetical protein NECAME_01464 [Necator americanus]ETN85572.1 hypothetical protein NECAME_01464 [Necator americanus]
MDKSKMSESTKVDLCRKGSTVYFCIAVYSLNSAIVLELGTDSTGPLQNSSDTAGVHISHLQSELCTAPVNTQRTALLSRSSLNEPFGFALQVRNSPNEGIEQWAVEMKEKIHRML